MKRSPLSSTVLVVDTNTASHSAIEDSLTPLGARVMHAYSCIDALELLELGDIVLVLISADMQEEEGYKTARYIKNSSLFASTAVFMMSEGEELTSTLKIAYGLSDIDFIHLPIQGDVLRARLKDQISDQAVLKIQWERNLYFETMMDCMQQGVLAIDCDGYITYANKRACDLLEIEHKAILTSKVQRFQNQTNSEPFYTYRHSESVTLSPLIQNLIKRNPQSYLESERWRTANNRMFFVDFTCGPIFDSKNVCKGAIISFWDVSGRKKTEEKLIHFAKFDALTDLANRAFFFESFNKAISRSNRSGRRLALLIVNVDNFKYVNDKYGHDTGDEILHAVSDVIRRNTRAGDLIARLGGDEFGIVLHDIRQIGEAETVAGNIITAISQTRLVSSVDLKLSVSVGISLYRSQSTKLDDLITEAETAKNTAKARGRNSFQSFEPPMQLREEKKRGTQIMLQNALLNQEFSLAYQPKVSLPENKVTGVEALLRWYTQGHGQISPSYFIPIAEESGQIVEIGNWVIEHVCKQIQAWKKLQEFTGVKTSINLSLQQLRKTDFHKFVFDVMKKYEINGDEIEFELKEASVRSDMDEEVRQLKLLNKMGIKISLDNFGTGTAGLSQLRNLPLDALKIDKCFIDNIGVDRKDEDIIQVIISIANTMGIGVVAEGVETLEQLAFLADLKCQQIQGFFFSEATSADEFLKILRLPKTHFMEQFDQVKSINQDGSMGQATH